MMDSTSGQRLISSRRRKTHLMIPRTDALPHPWTMVVVLQHALSVSNPVSTGLHGPFTPCHSPIHMLDNGASCMASGSRPCGNIYSREGALGSWRDCACTSRAFVHPQLGVRVGSPSAHALVELRGLAEPRGHRLPWPSRGSATAEACPSHRRSLHPLATCRWDELHKTHARKGVRIDSNLNRG